MPRTFGRSRVRNRIFPAILFILCSTFSAHTLRSQNADKPSIWKSNEALLNQLDSAKSIEEFLINPPKGYNSQTQSGPHGSRATVWAGPPRHDGTRPQVMILTVTLPPEELNQYNLEQILDELVARLSPQRKDWKLMPTEQGLINGLLFARTRWSGTDIPTGRKMHGFNYVTIVGEKVVQLSSQDVEPHHKEALELAESSALTFKAR
jgi:hypothetical protein